MDSSSEDTDHASDDEFQDAQQDLDENSCSTENELLGYKPVSKMDHANLDGKLCTANSDGLYRY